MSLTSLFLVIHCQPILLKNVVTCLEDVNFITDRLSLGDCKFMVCTEYFTTLYRLMTGSSHFLNNNVNSLTMFIILY